MMSRVTAGLAVALLAGCSGDPIGFGTPGGGGGGGGGAVDADPQVIAGGEVNNVVFDSATDTITINNLPFDGQVYTNTGFAGVNGFGLYETVQVGDAGTRKFFALYREAPGAELQVIAVATGDFQDEGIGGFEVTRTAANVTLPTEGEALFTGPYGGIRVLNPAFGGDNDVQFTSGVANIAVDFGDFDVVGAVEGQINNRVYFDVNGNFLGTLPTIILSLSEIGPNGTVPGGTAQTLDAANEVLDSGTYEALFANETEIGGVVILDGPFTQPNGTEIGVNERGVFTVSR